MTVKQKRHHLLDLLKVNSSESPNSLYSLSRLRSATCSFTGARSACLDGEGLLIFDEPLCSLLILDLPIRSTSSPFLWASPFLGACLFVTVMLWCSSFLLVLRCFCNVMLLFYRGLSLPPPRFSLEPLKLLF